MFHRILLAIDNRESRLTGISFVSALAAQHSAPVHVVHVNPFLVGGRGFTTETATEASSLIDDALAQLRGAGVEATGCSRVATPFNLEKTIVEEAHGWSADVIVLGSRRHHRFGRLHGPGVRDRVTNLTHLPVLTAPSPLTDISERRIRPSNAVSAAKRLLAHISS